MENAVLAEAPTNVQKIVRMVNSTAIDVAGQANAMIVAGLVLVGNVKEPRHARPVMVTATALTVKIATVSVQYVKVQAIQRRRKELQIPKMSSYCLAPIA